MKRIFLAILTTLISCGFAFAAGSTTVTATNTKSIATGKTEFISLAVAFTADASDGSIPDTTLTAYMDRIVGTELLYVLTDGNHAGTEPQEDSEVYVYIDGFDVLGGDGVDQLDNTAEREIKAEIAAKDAPHPILSGQTVTVTITQQAAVVNSATGTVTLVFKVR